MGSKYKLLPHLAEAFADVGGNTALDAFSGSGVVSYLLKQQGYSVHSNDYLGFPGIVAQASVVNQTVKLTATDIARITGPAADDRDFIRRTFEGIYYTPGDLEFLDAAWSHIATMRGHKRNLAVASLCLAAARKQPRGVFTISGDLSHYDDGRRDLRMSLREHFVARAADYNAAVFKAGAGHEVTSVEVADLESRRYDVVYLDPPYAPPTDDNDYTKRFHFLEGLSRYWVGDTIMAQTKTHKLPKRVTKFSSKRTIEEGFRDLFKRFHDSTLVLSYSSNALPDRETLLGLLREFKDDVEVRVIPHTYHYGTHSTAERRKVDEYLFIGR
ncbi:DNA adenine methylase [Phycicoccus sp. M110.8]|uniref:DNA adenine methylase n=1 Tax=Phycicoccus sp. M110.8 TaxID=3075433 RepID=UPI0028FD5736|nr:DNA adenine methylase [Phycicoccus sp. M110.8]MDU0312767.1 DNA adenine methylase [Phycicoccus sp. M110.8]